jgi:hypothetical protein
VTFTLRVLRKGPERVTHDRIIEVVEPDRPVPGETPPILCHRDTVPARNIDRPTPFTFVARVPTGDHCPAGRARYTQETVVMGAVFVTTIRPPPLFFRIETP